jgi:hypothetical protein
MSLLTNPPGSIKTALEIKHLLIYHRETSKLFASLFAAPGVKGHHIVIFSFTKHSFMYKNKLCQIGISIPSRGNEPYFRDHHVVNIVVSGRPIQVPRIYWAGMDMGFPKSFLFTNYWNAYAHILRIKQNEQVPNLG